MTGPEPLAGDAFYAVLFFGGFALAERLFSAFRQPSRDVVS